MTSPLSGSSLRYDAAPHPFPEPLVDRLPEPYPMRRMLDDIVQANTRARDSSEDAPGSAPLGDSAAVQQVLRAAAERVGSAATAALRAQGNSSPQAVLQLLRPGTLTAAR